MAGRAPRRAAADIVVSALAPYVGENMARASVSGHLYKLGLGRELDGDGLDRLLAAIAPGLGVFVGRERTKQLTEEIRAAVVAERGRA